MMKDVWRFLVVLLAGVITALLALLWLTKGGEEREKRMYTYQVLLSPETIETMGNRAIRLDKGEGVSNSQVESIRFSFLNPKTEKWEERFVDLDLYSKFFEQIEADRGFLNPSEETLKSFQGDLPKLVLFVKRSAGPSLFQSIEFSSTGNVYRIDLSRDQTKKEWVYFSHRGILPFAMENLKR